MAIWERPITPAYVKDSATPALYTADASLSRALIKKLTFCNTDSVARTVIVYLVPAGGTAGPTNQLTNARSLLSGETWECFEAVNQCLLGGGMIQAVASLTDKINIMGTVAEHSA